MFQLLPVVVERLVNELLPLLPFTVPVGVALCVVYLLANDLLDVLLLANVKGWSNVRPIDVRDALVNDVANRAALTAAVVGFVSATAAGGDLRAQLSAALVAVAAANVANLETGSLTKLQKLLNGATDIKVVVTAAPTTGPAGQTGILVQTAPIEAPTSVPDHKTAVIVLDDGTVGSVEVPKV